jgi:hypothetical protein
MANTVIAIRSSGVTGNTPSLGVLANGELSLNFADGILYYKSSSNTLGSIRTTAVSGLTTEVQFNDAGSFGANSNFTFNKTLATLNVKNINVSTNLIATTANLTVNSITTGTGVGGIIAGANVIYSNVFVANTGGITTAGNSTLNGIVTVSYVAGAGNQNSAMEMIGANTKGGTGYFDFISANNNSGGTTNKNKYFRIDSNGKFQIINSLYTAAIFDLNDSGYLTIPGALQTAQYIQFSDGSKQYTANAGSGGGGVTQIVAGTNVTLSPAGGTGVVTINSTGGGTTDFGFGQIYTSNNSTYANATSANDKVTFAGESGVYVYANSTTKTITVAGTPGAQGMTVDYGWVSEAIYYSIDYGTL